MSKDTRTITEKLRDMARDESSPNEALAAQKKLAEYRLRSMGIEPPEWVNPYGDIIFADIPELGGWVGLWTSGHFPDDEK